MKKLFAALMSLLLALSLCAPVLAATDYGAVYDATDLLDADSCQTLAGTLTELGERYSTQLQVDVVNDLEGETLEDYAGLFFEQYGYGDPDTGDCIYLMLYLTADETGLAFGGYKILTGGSSAALLAGFADEAAQYLDPWLNGATWDAGLQEDNAAFTAAIQEYASCAETYLASGGSGTEPVTEGAPVETGEAQLDYVTDAAGLLTDEEWQELESKAESISAEYQCAVYIVTVDDYINYGDGDVSDVAKGIYQDYALGFGEDKSGLLLLLSMADRDFSLLAYGYGNTAFTDYGKERLEDEFLGYFGDDQWADGFEAYLDTSGEMLAMARSGSPLDIDSDPTVEVGGVAISVLLALIISLVVCFILKAGMQSVAEKSEADAYISQDGVNFTVREDYFTHATESRVTVERSSGGGGGTSIDSDGFSSDSGKF